MHFDSETGNCDYVSYDKYLEMLEEKDNKIESLQTENINLKEELYEAKEILNKFKKELQKYEGVTKEYSKKM